MYTIKFEIVLTKQITKDIEKKLLEIINILQDKLKQQKKDFKYKKVIKNKQKIQINVSSKDLTATDSIVQLDKQIREVLGREFKVGIKDFKINSYTITDSFEETPKKKVSIPLVKKLEFKNKEVTLYYENIPFDWVKDHYIERSLKLIKDKIKMLNYEGKDEFKEYIWESKQKKTIYNGDPAVDLEKLSWIKRTDAKGQFVYGREFTALVNTIKELFIEKIYIPLGFFEMIFPKFEPWIIPKKSGHAKNIYPLAYFVTVPKNSGPEYWEKEMDLFAITGEVQTDKIMEKTTSVGIMSYAQCPPFWPYLQNKIIDEKTLPLLIYDWSGPTYRNESGGTHGLDRIEEFHRIETLFVGINKQVVKIREDLKNYFIKFYDETLDLEIKVAKVTPWWMAHAGIKTAHENPDVGTYDFESYLPYRGDRSKEWLEIQNDSSNGDKYPKAFHVKLRSGEFLWSGCAGNSMQRIIVAFLAQKGLDSKNWPKEVREKFENKIRGINTLKFY